MVQVMDQRVKVDLQHSFMDLLLQQLADLFKLKNTRTFQQDGLIMESGKRELRQEITGGVKKKLLPMELSGKGRDIFSDTNDPCDPGF